MYLMNVCSKILLRLNKANRLRPSDDNKQVQVTITVSQQAHRWVKKTIQGHWAFITAENNCPDIKTARPYQDSWKDRGLGRQEQVNTEEQQEHERQEKEIIGILDR